jgi:hypothetical protein
MTDSAVMLSEARVPGESSAAWELGTSQRISVPSGRVPVIRVRAPRNPDIRIVMSA